MRLVSVASGIALLVLTASASADTAIKPGRWEVTGKMDLGGMELPPGMPVGQPIHAVTCISAQEAKQAADGSIPLPEDANCTMGEKTSSGNLISLKMSCNGAAVTVDATVHSPESYSGTMITQGAEPAHTMTMKFAGKRTGDACSAQEQAADDARSR
jgi:hypothetical protein